MLCSQPSLHHLLSTKSAATLSPYRDADTVLRSDGHPRCLIYALGPSSSCFRRLAGPKVTAISRCCETEHLGVASIRKLPRQFSSPSDPPHPSFSIPRRPFRLVTCVKHSTGWIVGSHRRCLAASDHLNPAVSVHRTDPRMAPDPAPSFDHSTQGPFRSRIPSTGLKFISRGAFLGRFS